jgi:16S rRNA (uracil1498-N3)-methyltransferase
MDDIIDKLTQLGVDRIIPLETERVIVKWDKNQRVRHLERFQKIALNASQQSQRKALPVIEPIKDIKEVISTAAGYDLKLIPHLMGERKTLKEIFIKNRPKNILVLIGPEGDFSSAEVALAKRAGFIPVSLGDLVLRVETAAVAIASFIRLYLNN